MNIVEQNEDTPISKFMVEFMAATTENWFDPRARVFNGVATIELGEFDGSVYISDIRAVTPGEGQGTAALKFLCDLADKYGVTLSLCAKAYTKDRLTTRQLAAWYARYGFVKLGGQTQDGFEMERKKKRLVLGNKSRIIPIDSKRPT